jgi:alpha-galactosidase
VLLEVMVDGHAAPFGDVVSLGGLEVVTRWEPAGSGHVLHLMVRNPSRSPRPVARVGMRVALPHDRALEHGMQSFSTVRVCRPDDVRPERGDAPTWRRAMYAADPALAGRAVTGEPFLVTDGGVVGFLGGAAHLSTVVSRPDGTVDAWALLDGIALPPGEARPLDPLWISRDDPGRAYSELADHWADASGAIERAARAAPDGWCSWYRFYAEVTPEDVRRNLATIRAHGLELVLIDDGYQPRVGDWLAPSARWPSGTVSVAADIADRGGIAGIWLAPFLAVEHSDVVRDHPEWLLRDDRNRPVRAMHNPRYWGGWALALDPTHPGVRDHLMHVVGAFREQGFATFKLDFAYAGALPGRRFDRRSTRAEALRAGLDAVRTAAGDDAYLLGCGCPFGPAAGVVDAMRVSPDAGSEWVVAPRVAGYAESTPGVRTALVTSTLRAPLHRRLWVNDPDCLVLRPRDTDLEPWHRARAAELVGSLGGALLVSDDLDAYGDDEWALLERARQRRAAADRPVDLVDPFADPLQLRSGEGLVTVDLSPPA